MDALFQTAGHARVLGLATLIVFAVSGYPVAAVHKSTQGAERAVGKRLWPCRLVAEPTLLGVIEDGWKRSATLRRQCEELADARAVVALEWGKTDAQSRALTQIRLDKERVVVATVAIPPVSGAIELVAHELEHVLERTRGVNFGAESKRRGSGVWRAFGGYETQRAIDIGHRVREEIDESGRSSGQIRHDIQTPPLPADPEVLVASCESTGSDARRGSLPTPCS